MAWQQIDPRLSASNQLSAVKYVHFELTDETSVKLKGPHGMVIFPDSIKNFNVPAEQESHYLNKNTDSSVPVPGHITSDSDGPLAALDADSMALTHNTATGAVPDISTSAAEPDGYSLAEDIYSPVL